MHTPCQFTLANIIVYQLTYDAVVVTLYSDTYKTKRHLQCSVKDMYAKSPSDFSLLLKCVLNDMGSGDCPVSSCSHHACFCVTRVSVKKVHLVLCKHFHNFWKTTNAGIFFTRNLCCAIHGAVLEDALCDATFDLMDDSMI